MKQVHKTISIILTAVLLFSTTITVYANELNEWQEEAKYIELNKWYNESATEEDSVDSTTNNRYDCFEFFVPFSNDVTIKIQTNNKNYFLKSYTRYHNNVFIYKADDLNNPIYQNDFSSYFENSNYSANDHYYEMLNLNLEKGSYYLIYSYDNNIYSNEDLNGSYDIRILYDAPIETPSVLKVIERNTASIKLGWSRLDDVNGYQLQYKVGDTYKNIAYTAYRTYTVKNLLSGRFYSFRVRGYKTVNGKKYYGKWKTLHAGTNPKSPSITSVSAVSCGFTVNYKQVTNASGYQVECSLYKNFKNPKIVTVKGGTKTKRTVENLKSKKKYYVRVRAYKKASSKYTYSAWSKTVVITTKASKDPTHDHGEITGNMDKWFNSRAEVNDYYNSVVDYWVNKEKNGEITLEEMFKNCPSGYECWSCAECGKWTGNFYD